MSVTPPAWFVLLIAGVPALIGIIWAASLLWRKASLAEIFCLVTYWAMIFGALFWIR